MIDAFENLELALRRSHDHPARLGTSPPGELTDPDAAKHIRHGDVGRFEVLKRRAVENQSSKLIVTNPPRPLRASNAGLLDRANDGARHVAVDSNLAGIHRRGTRGRRPWTLVRVRQRTNDGTALSPRSPFSGNQNLVQRDVHVVVRPPDLSLIEKSTRGQRVEITRGGQPRDAEVMLDELDLRVRMAEQIVDEILAVELVRGTDALFGLEQ